jgi:hypothetical protein
LPDRLILVHSIASGIRSRLRPRGPETLHSFLQPGEAHQPVLLDGTYQIAAGGDGVKAQNRLAIANGTVTVSESSEGIEARHIAISGDTVSVTASDGGR